MFETNMIVLNQRRLQLETNILKQKRDELHKKYGFVPMQAQMLPFIPALIQLPIHLTMYVSINTMLSSYPLWNSGGFITNNGYNFSDLSLTDNTFIFPVSIGLTMGILQFVFNYKNILQRSVINSSNKLKILSIGLISYLSMNWTIGFNLYILSNLFPYVLQQLLLNINQFRKFVGLKNINESMFDYIKVQIVNEITKFSLRIK